MKKLLFLILFVSAQQLATAQNTIAKIKYEQAEEAYVNGDYKLALQKVKETEEMLKSSNPKTLFLKIMAADKLLESDYTVITQLKKDVDTYMANYESVTELEDKFREVYAVYEKISQLDASQQAIDSHMKKITEERAMADKARKDTENLYNYAGGFLKKHNLCIACSWSEFKQLNPLASQSNYTTSDNGSYWGEHTISYIKDGADIFEIQAAAMVKPDGTLIYGSVVLNVGKKMNDAHMAQFNQLKKEVYDAVPGEYIKEVQNAYGGLGIIVTVPKTATTPEYYIRYSYGSHNNKSMVCAHAGTNYRIISY